ncbi:hypothetical protein Pfo_019818 [Paulownia fortunei]|nr:hypothetical protein Pfo_019818 [Paulownia fortunei]
MVWNVRGIGNEPTQKHVHNFCRLHKIKIMVVLEPKVQLDSNFFCRRFAFSQVFANCSNKIWCFVNNEFQCKILSDQEQFLHMEVKSHLLPSTFLLTFIYAKCDIAGRRELWNALRDIAEQNDAQPWLIGGDFNTILHLNERTGNNGNRLTSMNDFGDMIGDCGLIDAGYEGSSFTWTNHKVWKRLDRVLYSEEWLNLFHNTKVSHLPRIWSDHSPLLISLDTDKLKAPSPFRFFRMWSRHHTFWDTVKDSWRYPTETQGMKNLQQKLYRLKQRLRWWNKNIFGDIFENVKKAKQEVADKEKEYDENPCDANLTELKRCTAVLTHNLTIEEDYWRQKAACRWIVEGERNTKYFHSLVKKKRNQSRIHSIIHEGVQLSEQEEIKNSAASYFQSLLTNDVPDLTEVNMDCIQQIQQNSETEKLCSVPDMEEIRQAVFAMDLDSVAGPDGFSAFFFQHCWDIIHMDIKEAVVDFFKGNTMPRSFTATSIVLIPKIENPKTWGDFRPISLCNVNNKIFSKIISNRLVNILPEIISPAQSGFVKGRLISDNILLAQELMHTINAKCKHENVALKLDMNKAYDRVQWSFLYKVLKKMGFPATWITLVQKCIEHCWFSVLINGNSAGFFQSSRGLRQGDPLSPSLFIIAADFLSRSLDTLFQHNKELRYHSKGGLNISHLAYADDVIIFTNSSRMGLRKIIELLRKYAAASGQIINKEKSSFIVSTKCSNLIIQRLQYATGFNFKHLPITYLGGPLFKGNKKCSLFQDLISKMRYKIQGWEKSSLAHGGRLALIKNTLSMMPIYLLQVLQPPKMVLHRIEQIMARFFWGTYGDQKRMHWVSWDRICQPIKEGGLRIRKLADMVQAFSLKLWWRFRSMSSLWAAFMQQKYCGCLFLGAVKISVHDSSNWKRMCKGLGDGQAYFWQDHWIGEAPLAATNQRELMGHSAVNFFWQNKQWNVERLGQLLPQNVVNKICNMDIHDDMDAMIWKLTPDGEFSTKSAWNLIRSSRNERQLLGDLWCNQLTPTMSIFVWRLMNNCIPVDIRLQEKEFPVVSRCYCCLSSMESIPHLFISGGQATVVWEHFANLFNIKHPQTENPTLLFQYWKLSTPFSKPNHIRIIIPLLIFWFLWTERNNAKYRSKGFHANRVIWKIYDHLFFIWKKPQIGWFKLNTDGAAKGETGQAGAGGVIRDHLGNVVVAYYDYIGNQNSTYAEFSALAKGLELAKDCGIANLWIEMDAQTVIKLVSNNTSKGHWRLQEMLVKSKYIMSQMHTHITHIYPRGEQNCRLSC